MKDTLEIIDGALKVLSTLENKTLVEKLEILERALKIVRAMLEE